MSPARGAPPESQEGLKRVAGGAACCASPPQARISRRVETDDNSVNVIARDHNSEPESQEGLKRTEVPRRLDVARRKPRISRRVETPLTVPLNPRHTLSAPESQEGLKLNLPRLLHSSPPSLCPESQEGLKRQCTCPQSSYLQLRIQNLKKG